MSTWLRPEQILGLPGLPGSRRRLLLVARRDSWPYRQIACRGGYRHEFSDEVLARYMPGAADQTPVAPLFYSDRGRKVRSEGAGLVGVTSEPAPFIPPCGPLSTLEEALLAAVADGLTTEASWASLTAGFSQTEVLGAAQALQARGLLVAEPAYRLTAAGHDQVQAVAAPPGPSTRPQPVRPRPSAPPVPPRPPAPPAPPAPDDDDESFHAAQEPNAPASLLTEDAEAPAGGKEAAELEVVRLYEEWCDGPGAAMAKRQRAAVFAARWVSREIGAPKWLYNTIPHFSDSTILRWCDRAPRPQAGSPGRRASLLTDEEAAEVFEALLHEYPQASVPRLRMLAAQRLGPARLPSVRTLERWVADYKQRNAARLEAYLNPDGYRSRYGAAFGTYAASRPNERWELDSTPTDVMVSCADGSKRRFTLVGAIDVFTRRLKVVVAPVSSGEAIALVLRRALLDWGLPETVKTDQGRDYASHRIRTVLRQLGIKHELCPPFTPQAKPYIERALGILSHELLPTLPGYLGHNVATRKAIESRRSFAQRHAGERDYYEFSLSAEELQQAIDAHLANREQQPHSELNCTPLEAWLKAGAPKRAVPDERALDVLLAPVATGGGWRTVTKKGIANEGGLFIHSELALHEGQRVQCRLDSDMGVLFVFDAAEKFICIAQDVTRLGVKRAAVAEHAKAKQKQANREHRQRVKQLSGKHRIGDLVEDYQNAQAAVAARVTPLRTDERTAEATPAMEAAANAAEARRDLPAPRPRLVEEPKARKQSRYEDPIFDELEEVVMAGDDAPADRRAWVEDLCQRDLAVRKFVASAREAAEVLRRRRAQ